MVYGINLSSNYLIFNISQIPSICTASLSNVLSSGSDSSAYSNAIEKDLTLPPPALDISKSEEGKCF